MYNFIKKLHLVLYLWCGRKNSSKPQAVCGRPVLIRRSGTRCKAASTKKPSPLPKACLGHNPIQKGERFVPISPGRIRGMFAGVIFLTVFLLQPLTLFAQNYSTTIHKTARFQNASNAENELQVYNINGSVTVEGYDGNTIQITSKEQIKGSNKEVQRGKSELHFTVKQLGNKVLVYIDAPFVCLKHYNDHYSYKIHRNNDGSKYHFLFDIHIRVPKQAYIRASTINGKTVSINNTKREVIAYNVNGSIKLTHISGKTEARTINGSITAKYDKSPAGDSKYKTVNGDITAYYPADLSADIRFKSLHGGLYTNFDDIKRLKAQVHTGSKNGKKMYRIGKDTPIQIGKGGPMYRFKVLNGDVTIKKH